MLVLFVVSIAVCGLFIGGCKLLKEIEKAADQLKDEEEICKDFLDGVKKLCGDDSAAYKKQKEKFDKMQKGTKRTVCEMNLTLVWSNTWDFSKKPDFTKIKTDLTKKTAEENWDKRKAQWEGMTPDQQKQTLDAVKNNCVIWEK
jgi:hypothetical protein